MAWSPISNHSIEITVAKRVDVVARLCSVASARATKYIFDSPVIPKGVHRTSRN